MDGRPVVTNFDIDLYYTVDWNAAKGALASNPVFLFQHSRGFSHVQSEALIPGTSPTAPITESAI